MKTRKKFCREFKVKALEMGDKSDNIKDVVISLGIRKGF
jgi:hypothetical protein